MASSGKKMHSESYIKFGLTSINKQGKDSPQCVIGQKVLSEGSMKPSLLKRHLSSCHPELSDKDQSYFERKALVLKRIRFDHTGQVHDQNGASLRASYMVTLRVAQNKDPHTIVETFVSPCCKDIVSCFFGENAAQKLNTLPSLNDTVHRRICDLSEDICNKLLRKSRKLL
ncbi:zinc finger BED domain-containing protein 5-like [Oratosquilla oratoria]|uniref:zinc finger BED domain-containing protein 5-like n=1 Tax=Oratosquilla oratoria TaxID=337810 RepID=UPI003F772243